MNHNDGCNVLIKKVALKDLLEGDYVRIFPINNTDPMTEMTVGKVDEKYVHFAYPYWAREFEIPGIAFAHFETSFFAMGKEHTGLFYEVKRWVKVPNYFTLKAHYPDMTFNTLESFQERLDMLFGEEK